MNAKIGERRDMECVCIEQALLAFATPSTAAPALRSAFVPVMVPAMPLTAVQGSVQNKPGIHVC